MMEPAIVSSLIEASGSVLAAVIAALTAGWIGKKWLDQEAIVKKLQLAADDIEFMLALEKLFIEKTRDVPGMPGRNTMRDLVKKDTGLTWSGKFTPSRLGRIRGNC